MAEIARTDRVLRVPPEREEEATCPHPPETLRAAEPQTQKFIAIIHLDLDKPPLCLVDQVAHANLVCALPVCEEPPPSHGLAIPKVLGYDIERHGLVMRVVPQAIVEMTKAPDDLVVRI